MAEHDRVCHSAIPERVKRGIAVKVWLWITLAAGLLFYAVSLVLFARLKYDAGFACILAASVLIITSAVLAIVRAVRRRKK